MIAGRGWYVQLFLVPARPRYPGLKVHKNDCCCRYYCCSSPSTHQLNSNRADFLRNARNINVRSILKGRHNLL